MARTEKLTKRALLDLLSDKIAHQMSKLALEHTKKKLQLRLESFDTDDFLWSDAQDAAKADISKEYGSDEFSDLGNHEDPKKFVGGLQNASEKDVDNSAASWKMHYAQFGERLAAFLGEDPQLDAMRGEDEREFLNAMARAMFKYMMDNNSSSPFISSVQQWIIDLDDTFDPTDEESGEVEMGPVEHRIYKRLGVFQKIFDRGMIKKNASRLSELNEERWKLKKGLSLLREAWDWSYSPEGINSIEMGIDHMSHGALVEIMGEWDAYETAGRSGSVMDADFDSVDKTRYALLPHDVLAQAVFTKAEQFRTSDNGGHHAWACPYGCHTVNLSQENAVVSEDIDDGFSEPSVQQFEYNINLDERGLFYADVRDANGETVYEIKVGYGEDEDNDVFSDGFMKHKRDIGALEAHLKNTQVIPMNGEIVFSFSEGSVNEDLDDMSLDSGDLTDDPASAESAYRVDDVSHGYYVAPPFGDDPLWYVVDDNHDPVQGYATEEEAKAAIPGLEASQRGEDQLVGRDMDGYGTEFKESRVARLERLLNEADMLVGELRGSGFYPSGAEDDLSAPFNDPAPADPAPQALHLVDHQGNCIIVRHGNDLYAVSTDPLDHNQTTEDIVAQLNMDFAHLSIGHGLQAWHDGMSDLVKIDPALAIELKGDYPTLAV